MVHYELILRILLIKADQTGRHQHRRRGRQDQVRAEGFSSLRSGFSRCRSAQGVRRAVPQEQTGRLPGLAHHQLHGRHAEEPAKPSPLRQVREMCYVIQVVMY